jgi:hypothetical protein
MAIAVSEIRPVAHLPLVLGLLRKLEVMAVIDTLCPPHPEDVVSCGMGVEALVLAIWMGPMRSTRWGNAWRRAACYPCSKLVSGGNRSTLPAAVPGLCA